MREKELLMGVKDFMNNLNQSVLSIEELLNKVKAIDKVLRLNSDVYVESIIAYDINLETTIEIIFGYKELFFETEMYVLNTKNKDSEGFAQYYIKSSKTKLTHYNLGTGEEQQTILREIQKLGYNVTICKKCNEPMLNRLNADIFYTICPYCGVVHNGDELIDLVEC